MLRVWRFPLLLHRIVGFSLRSFWLFSFWFETSGHHFGISFRVGLVFVHVCVIRQSRCAAVLFLRFVSCSVSRQRARVNECELERDANFSFFGSVCRRHLCHVYSRVVVANCLRTVSVRWVYVLLVGLPRYSFVPPLGLAPRWYVRFPPLSFV